MRNNGITGPGSSANKIMVALVVIAGSIIASLLYTS